MATLKGARGTKTRLAFGLIEADVQLYGTVADAPKLSEYATAGPNGKALRYVQKAEAAPVEETPEGAPVPVHSGAPLAVEDPGGIAGGVLDGTYDPGGPPTPDAWVPPPSEPGHLRQVLVEEGDEDEVEVTAEMIRRGMRLEDGTFVDLTDQLAAIEAQTKLERMEVIATLDVGQVPRPRVLGSYYLTGDDTDAPKVLRVLYEAMKRTRRVCVVKWTAKTKQSLGVITPGADGALLVLKLAWAEDWRESGQRQLAHLQAQVYEQEVDAAAELILALAEKRADGLDALRDDARRLREELEASVKAGEVETFEMPPVLTAAPEKDFSELLSASVMHARAAA